MRDGIVHWVSKETWDNVSRAMDAQTGHQFLTIRELGNIKLNTADMTGLYTVLQYETMVRIKQGQFQCSYQKWHKKKEECECAKEARERHEAEMDRLKRDEEHRRPTPEERVQIAERLQKGNELWALNGASLGRSLFAQGNRLDRKMRRSTISAWEKDTGKRADVSGLSID